jgi:hypothetical protein
MADIALRCPRCAGILQWHLQTEQGVPVYQCGRCPVDERPLYVSNPLREVRLEKHGDYWLAIQKEDKRRKA